MTFFVSAARKRERASKRVEALIAAGIIDILVYRATLSNCCYIFGELSSYLGFDLLLLRARFCHDLDIVVRDAVLKTLCTLHVARLLEIFKMSVYLHERC